MGCAVRGLWRRYKGSRFYRACQNLYDRIQYWRV
jgi:hypothetical protein